VAILIIRNEIQEIT